MPRKVVNVYRKNKRKSHPHSKNQVRQVQEEGVEVVYVKMKPIQ